MSQIGHSDFYQLFDEHSTDTILLTTHTDEICTANPAACMPFGRTEYEIRSPGRVCLVDINGPRILKTIEIRENTDVFRGELTHILANGEHVSAKAPTVIFLDENTTKELVILSVTSQNRNSSNRNSAHERNNSTRLHPLPTYGDVGSIHL